MVGQMANETLTVTPRSNSKQHQYTMRIVIPLVATLILKLTSTNTFHEEWASGAETAFFRITDTYLAKHRPWNILSLPPFPRRDEK